MILFQLVATLFITFALQRVLNRYKEERVPKSELMVWAVFWLLVAVAVWWPQGTDIVAAALGISRGVDLFVAASVAVIFYLLFKLFAQVHHMDREMTRLVRKLALDKEKEGEDR